MESRGPGALGSLVQDYLNIRLSKKSNINLGEREGRKNFQG